MLKTEMRNTATTHIDTASTQEMLHLIQNENLYAVNAVGNAIPYIVKACDAIEKSMKKGGRLIYIGAGTSGRLGIIDATECPPTFGVEPDRVMGIIAGGKECQLMETYRKHCMTLGQEIVIIQNDTKQAATALDVNDDGALWVRLADSTEKAINFGEVSIRGICGYV